MIAKAYICRFINLQVQAQSQIDLFETLEKGAKYVQSNDFIEVVLVFLLLTLNIFHIFFYCFYC